MKMIGRGVVVAWALTCLSVTAANADTAAFFRDYDSSAVLSVKTIGTLAGPEGEACYTECELVSIQCDDSSLSISLRNLTRHELGTWLLADHEPPAPLRPEMLKIVVHFDAVSIETLLWDIDYDDFAGAWRANADVFPGMEQAWLQRFGSATEVAITTPGRDIVFPDGVIDIDSRRVFAATCLKLMDLSY